MPNFKTTKRGMDKSVFIPDKDAILKMMGTATTPEAANYAAKQTANRLGKSETTTPIINKVFEFAARVKEIFNKQSSGSLWTGRGEPLTDFVSLQKVLADESINNIKDDFQKAGLLDENNTLKGELELDFAVNDDAQLIQGYKLNGQPVQNKDTVDSIDNVFKAWLAEKGMFYKDGQLYEVDDTGKIKKNQKGEDILMRKEEVFNRLQDDKDGFASYLQNQGLQTKVTRRAFPEAEEVKSALQSGKKTVGIKDSGGVGVEPEPKRSAPTGPSSSA